MFDEYGNYMGDDFGSGGTLVDGWTDNGDGTFTGPDDQLYDGNGVLLTQGGGDTTTTDPSNYMAGVNPDGSFREGFDDNGDYLFADGSYLDLSTGEIVPATTTPDTGFLSNLGKIFGGDNSASSLAKAADGLAQKLAQAQAASASSAQLSALQRALATARAAATAAASAATGKTFLIAGLAGLGAYALASSRRP